MNRSIFRLLLFKKLEDLYITEDLLHFVYSFHFFNKDKNAVFYGAENIYRIRKMNIFNKFMNKWANGWTSKDTTTNNQLAVIFRLLIII